MRKLFGTDGIRGVAGEAPLDESTLFIIGSALGRYLRSNTAALPSRVVLGQDTRASSEWIAGSLVRGMVSQGVEFESAGVLTTPGVAYLARTRGFAAGIVISASHNPWRDNGIKIFGADGYKLADEIELEIEREIFAGLEQASPDPAPVIVAPVSRLAVVRASTPAPFSLASILPGDASLRGAYVRWLAGHVDGAALSHLQVLVDCANGAATPIAHEVFHRCGLNATFLYDQPDGRNINEGSGALHPEVVAGAVRQANLGNRGPRYDLGISFDGDADRALFADAEGNIVNGDAILLLCARSMQQRGALAGNVVVATTMSNLGLELALSASGIHMLRAPVGDKYVLEEMRRTGATLGGEQSGHILFRDGDATTGDGLLTALRVLAKMARAGRSLRELTHDLKVLPQAIQNVRVREKTPLEQVPEVAAAIREAEAELDGSGRIVVRYSGTEPLARVMVEAADEAQMRRLTGAVARAIEKALGA